MKKTSLLSKFSPKNIIKKFSNNMKIILKKDIDTSTEEGRRQKREQAIALTSVIASIAKIIALLVPFITVRVSRAYLGEEIYGLWSSVNSFFAVFAFADLGLGSGLQTNLSKANGKDDVEESKRLISSTFIVLLSVAGFLIFLFLGVYNFVNWASLVGAENPEAIALAGPVFLAIVIPKLIDVPMGLTQRTQVALQEGYNYYVWAIVGSALSIISVYLNSYLGSPKIVMILCSAAIPTIVSIINFIYYFCFSKRRAFFPKFKYFNWNTCKTMLITGVGFLIIHVLMNIGLSNMDSFIVGKIDNLSMAGSYSICLKVAAVVNVIANMFGLPLWGVYGEALSRGDIDYVKKHVVKRAILMLGLTGFATLCGMLLSPIAFKLIVGDDFIYNPLTLLGMFTLQCIFAVVNPFFMILNGTGDVKTQIMAYGIFAPFSFILKYFLAKEFGIDVMPWITALCYLIIMYPIIIRRAFRIVNSYKGKKESKTHFLSDEFIKVKSVDLKDCKFVVVKPVYGNIYDYCYMDLENISNVDLLKGHVQFNSCLLEKIYLKHFTKKFKLPFRRIWNRKFYKTKFDKNEELIFVLSYIDKNLLNYGAINSLRKKYKNSKFVLFFSDLIKTKLTDDEFFEASKLFDMILSFDYNDCENYNLAYNPLVYSAPKELENVEEDIDVYFCGKAKDRLELILSTFKQLKEKGFKCKFFINGVSQDKRENIDGLVYLDKFMSYEDNLDYVKRSKCLLEVMQEGGNGYTLRTCEAVAYNKKLITNNYMLKNSDFYDCDMISFFEEPYNIDTDFINKEKKNFKDRNYFSPIKLLEKIIRTLEK